MEAKKEDRSEVYTRGQQINCFIFDSWFSSKKAAESMMEVGTKSIGMVKTNKK